MLPGSGRAAQSLVHILENIKFSSRAYSLVFFLMIIFVALSDSFALPKGAKDRDNAIAWLKVSGSKAGQEAFNPKKGSICARIDCSNDAFKSVPETYAYLTSAAQDWQKDSIVPSVVHGAASFESWATEYKDIISLFAKSGDVAAAQAALQKACVTAGVCK